MNRVLVLTAATAIAAAAVAVAVAARPASGHSSRTFHFFEAFPGGNGTEVDASGNKRRVGDYVVFHTKLTDGEGGPVIGQNNAMCLHGHFKDYCHGVVLFNDRGTLTVDGLGTLGDEPHIDRFAVTGGTGEFIGQNGEMWFDSRKATDAGVDWTVTLVG
jgi:hypothetical protein